MLKRFLFAFSLVLSLVFALPLHAQTATSSGLKLLSVSGPNAYGSYDGVATFGGAMPTADQLGALRGLGLAVQGFDYLPLALLRGPRQAMFDAVSRGIAADVYPNEQLRFFSVSSDIAIKADQVQASGIDGAGVGVAVVDSGIDATHPDLRNRVKHNTKLIDLGTVAPGVTQPPIVIAVDQGPYNNSDTSSGHGTHVAGIIAADNSDGQVLGVAPGADLIGYGTGETVFIFNVLTAYDDILKHRNDWKIRVVNNSWGSSFRLFNPDEPINQATLQLYGAGIVVVFAAGNSTTEMSLNPYSAAPWVISVGNGTLSKQRNTTSSGGIQFDNSFLTLLPATDEKHLAFSGDRIGLYHPSVSAPGTNIVSTATTGVLVTGTPGGTASASGTSMASPHIAGVAALMLQRNPKLTPAEVKSAMQVTVDYMPSLADVTKVENFWMQGYGYVNAKAAVDLVGRARYSREKALAKLQATADQKVLGDRDYAVVATDYWSFTAAPATVNGTPDNKTYPLTVPSTTKAIKALVSYPSLGYVGVNEFDYHLTLMDAAGTVVAESTASSSAGMSLLFADLTKANYSYGNWTLNVRGDLGAQDQDTLMGILVSVAVHQLVPQARIARTFPVFTATGSSTYYLSPGALTGVPSPENCDQQAGAPSGGMTTTRPTGKCQSGSMGYAINYGVGTPGFFVSAPLAAPMTLGGKATFNFYLIDPLVSAWAGGPSNPRLTVEIDAIDAAGNLLVPIASSTTPTCPSPNGQCLIGAAQPVLGTYTVDVPPVTVPAGARLSVAVYLSAAVSSAARTVYGGLGLTSDFSNAALTLTTGALQ